MDLILQPSMKAQQRPNRVKKPLLIKIKTVTTLLRIVSLQKTYQFVKIIDRNVRPNFLYFMERSYI